MKCRVGGTESQCERCIRKSLHCIFQEHHRGRKPGFRVSRPSAGDAVPESQRADERRDWQTGNLQPPGILNHAATHGRFSLQSILEPFSSVPPPPPQVWSINPDDPIKLGLVNIRIAESLFENFMNSLNQYISQMDPELHTFSYVWQKCPFLFTAMLAAAAKVLHPELYPKLHKQVEELFGQSFRLGKKSAEIAQAVLIMTYWKEPDDSRAWVSLGYVIRMGIELGWHRLKPYTAAQGGISSDFQKRELRNIQRLWFILFVYDRSMSLQTGKPWMIERDAFIESIEPWCKDSMATSSDNLLGALVTLRLLSSEVFQLLGPKPSKAGGDQLHGLESLISSIGVRIEEWECKWLQSVAVGKFHPIRCYNSHFPDNEPHRELPWIPHTVLRYTLAPPALLTAASRDSHKQRIGHHIQFGGVLGQLLERNGNVATYTQLRGMDLFRARFDSCDDGLQRGFSDQDITQLLLSTPEYITGRIELQICDAIQSTADAFSGQSSPPGSSCWLQARFLERIVMKHVEKRRERDPDSSRAKPASSTAASDPALVAGSLGAHGTPHSGGHSTLNAQNDPIHVSRHLNEPRLDFALTGDGAWIDMFTSAGFSIQDGVFFA
ncbi:hypothetical protein PG996_008557 [Apiospora saccharicola]|uniref:Xylanolytic transcriptional activator regulatory domain-containing protein n=1 Tax=Apiospora saccharicola TaxID=335842 RepID=A0ABR1V0T8_9PEZI